MKPIIGIICREYHSATNKKININKVMITISDIFAEFFITLQAYITIVDGKVVYRA